MSTDAEYGELDATGVPELTPLGKQIELLRLERRMSKRILAQRAGTSRQQLWRVMTGKSDLTSSLCARLAEVLETDSRLLREASEQVRAVGHLATGPAGSVAARLGDSAGRSIPSRRGVGDGDGRFCESLEEYIVAPHGLERTFETLPLTEDGRRLKRVLLDAIEDIAIARSLKLPQTIFDLRRAVVNDDR
jgi:transcriptional regulator with XRE-family HTH domain